MSWMMNWVDRVGLVEQVRCARSMHGAWRRAALPAPRHAAGVEDARRVEALLEPRMNLVYRR